MEWIRTAVRYSVMVAPRFFAAGKVSGDHVVSEGLEGGALQAEGLGLLFVLCLGRAVVAVEAVLQFVAAGVIVGAEDKPFVPDGLAGKEEVLIGQAF